MNDFVIHPGSIISKKAAEGLNTLVLDVKVGEGAFMKDEQSAEQLARLMVNIINNFVTVFTVTSYPIICSSLPPRLC